jgi:hypothetical protein
LYAQQKAAGNIQLAKVLIPTLVVGGLAAIVIIQNKKKKK